MTVRRDSRARIAGVLVLCGLAALPLAAAEKSPQKVFGEVRPDEALVYLIREGHMLGAAVTVFAYADQQFLGTLRSNSYTFAYLPAGTYLLWAHPIAFTESNSRVRLEAGKVYYFNVWNTFDPLDEVSGPTFLKGIKSHVTPDEEEREDARKQIEKEYAKNAAKAATSFDRATPVDFPERREKHVAEWPQIDLAPYAILCIEEFVMADPGAGSERKDYLVESAPARLAGFVVDDLGPGVFAEVRRDAACAAAPGVVVLRARILEYEPGSETARAMIAGAGSAHLKVHITVANGETGGTLSQFDAKGLWAWGGQLGASRGIQDLEKNVAFEMASYLRKSKGIAEPPPATPR